MHEQEKPALVTMMTARKPGEMIELKFAETDQPEVSGVREITESTRTLTAMSEGSKEKGWVTKKYEVVSPSGRIGINGKITLLNCGGNDLTVLDVSKNSELTYLLCQNNKLETLSLSSNSKLNILDCNSNQLRTLDLSNNKSLDVLICYQNNITNLQLPSRDNPSSKGQLNFKLEGNAQNRLNREQVEEIKKKHWDIQIHRNGGWVPYQGDDVLS